MAALHPYVQAMTSPAAITFSALAKAAQQAEAKARHQADMAGVKVASVPAPQPKKPSRVKITSPNRRDRPKKEQ